MSAWTAVRNGARAWLHAQRVIADLRVNLAETRRTLRALHAEHEGILGFLDDIDGLDRTGIPEDWAR